MSPVHAPGSTLVAPGDVHSPARSPQLEARPARAAGTRPMDDAEVDAFLRSHEWGVLATVGETGPYAVPVSYGYDGESIFLAMGPGQKLRHLLDNPALCLTVVDVRTHAWWESVVVTGHAESLSGMRERVRALDAVRRQRSTVEFAASDLSRLAKARLLRIGVRAISGRRCG